MIATSGDLGFHHRKSCRDDLLMDCGAWAPIRYRSKEFSKETDLIAPVDKQNMSISIADPS